MGLTEAPVALAMAAGGAGGNADPYASVGAAGSFPGAGGGGGCYFCNGGQARTAKSLSRTRSKRPPSRLRSPCLAPVPLGC